MSLLALISAGVLACGSHDVREPLTDEASTETEIVVAQPDENVTCRNEKATGSHMVRRVCYTDAEKAVLEKNSRDWLRTRGASGGPTKVREPDDPRED